MPAAGGERLLNDARRLDALRPERLPRLHVRISEDIPGFVFSVGERIRNRDNPFTRVETTLLKYEVH